MKGEVIDEDRYPIGIVASRNVMSPDGKSIAETFASELAAKGFTIVSGMARGIDTPAHKEALKANGRSIAALGCGIDTPYLPENSKFIEELSRNGAVISEFQLGTPPSRENLYKRNRLISGLSLGVLIVEASKDKKVPYMVTDLAGLEINNEERAICNVLGSEPRHIDLISRETGIASQKLSGILLGLELKGIVKQGEGKSFFYIINKMDMVDIDELAIREGNGKKIDGPA